MRSGIQLVTYTAGRSVVPTELQDACRIIVWLVVGDTGNAGGSVAVPNMGGEGPLSAHGDARVSDPRLRPDANVEPVRRARARRLIETF